MSPVQPKEHMTFIWGVYFPDIRSWEDKKEIQEKLMPTHHFTEDDETNCRVVFKVRSKGALFPGIVILEGHASEDFKGPSPTCTLGTLGAPEASRGPNPFITFSYHKALTILVHEVTYIYCSAIVDTPYHVKFIRSSLLLITNMKLRYTP
jgi:hypothetical protein